MLKRLKQGLCLIGLTLLLSACPQRDEINGIKVPPEPDATKNNATLGGVDSNNNGIRDDVDRKIAEKWGKDKAAYLVVASQAQAMQTLLVNYSASAAREMYDSPDRISPNQKIKEAMDVINDFYNCTTPEEFEKLKGALPMTMNTKERKKAYGAMRLGVVGGRSLCKSKHVLKSSRQGSQSIGSTQEVRFVNGIMNTEDDVISTSDQIQALLNTSANRDANDKKTFNVLYVYNPTGYGDEDQCTINAWCDLKELAASKIAEEYFEKDFKQLIWDFDAPSWKYTSADRNQAVLNVMNAGYAHEKPSVLDVVLATQIEVAKQNKAGNSVILLAHSQGNLIANQVWARRVRDAGKNIQSSLRVVNVANTALFSPNNLDLTHEADRALSLLRAQGLTNARATEACQSVLGLPALCEFKTHDAFFQAPDKNGFDAINHGILETYLSSNAAKATFANGVVFGKKTGFRDRLEDLVYSAYHSLNPATLITQDTGSEHAVANVTPHTVKQPKATRTFDFVGVCYNGDVAGTGLCSANTSNYTCWLDRSTSNYWLLVNNDTLMTHQEATNRATTNSLLGLCGLNDWRIPSRSEFESILGKNNLPSGAHFPNNQSGVYRYAIANNGGFDTATGKDIKLDATQKSYVIFTSGKYREFQWKFSTDMKGLGQDLDFGRDALAAKGELIKKGAGSKGFDWTKVCNSGELAGYGSCPTNPNLGVGSNDWGCTLDNLNQIMWQADGSQTITNNRASIENRLKQIQIDGLCGATNWYVPTRAELSSIIDFGRVKPSADVDYFHNTQSSSYLTAEGVGINFATGNDASLISNTNVYLRLARQLRGSYALKKIFAVPELGAYFDVANQMVLKVCPVGMSPSANNAFECSGDVRWTYKVEQNGKPWFNEAYEWAEEEKQNNGYEWQVANLKTLQQHAFAFNYDVYAYYTSTPYRNNINSFWAMSTFAQDIGQYAVMLVSTDAGLIAALNNAIGLNTATGKSAITTQSASALTLGSSKLVDVVHPQYAKQPRVYVVGSN